MLMKLTPFERDLDRMIWRWYTAGAMVASVFVLAASTFQGLGLLLGLPVFVAVTVAMARLSTRHARQFAARVTREANQERTRSWSRS
jgi:uncharacterized protein (DUF58 family)